jgi:hypothetical protein
MRVLHYASRSVALVGLLAFAAGCGSDSTAPDAPFDADGTSSDIGAMNEAFNSPALEAYSSASTSISAVVGDEAAVAVKLAPTGALLTGGKASALRYARSIVLSYVRRHSSPTMAAMEIPAQYQGVTFIWDVETHQYAPSDLTGAPASGVRFILYAVNPVTQQPIEPLVPIDGYVDITMSETAASSTVRAVVVSSDVTYLDYTVHASGTAATATVSVTGYVTNGNDRVEFSLDNTLTSNGDGLGLAMDYEMVVPTRGGFLMDLETTVTGISTDTPTLTVDLLARGDHGTVRVQGTSTDASGNFTIRVNGDLFANASTNGTGTAVITGADGHELSEAEQHALETVFNMFANGFDAFEDLMDPIA